MSFRPTVALADLPTATAVRVQVDGLPVAVVRAEDGTVHAVDDTCSHANVSLAEGEVEDCSIECWLHGSRFDLRTGEPTGLPATAPIAVYAVDVTDGTVMVDVTGDITGDVTGDVTADVTATPSAPSKEH